jgi:hypothetical protein
MELWRNRVQGRGSVRTTLLVRQQDILSTTGACGGGEPRCRLPVGTCCSQHLNDALVARELLDGCFVNMDVREGTGTEGRIEVEGVLGGDEIPVQNEFAGDLERSL